jgi:hypothetical protein
MTFVPQQGDRLRVVKGHLVDSDDFDNERYADEDDEAEVIAALTYPGNGEPYYHIGVPRTGAAGFYDADELVEHFVPLAT